MLWLQVEKKKENAVQMHSQYTYYALFTQLLLLIFFAKATGEKTQWGEVQEGKKLAEGNPRAVGSESRL